MKNMQTVYRLLILSLLVVACNKKNKENVPHPIDDGGLEAPMGALRMHLHNYVDIAEVDGYNIVYTNTEGRKIMLTKAQVYLSDFELVKLDGSVYSIPNNYILKVQDNQVYELGEVPVGNYKSVRFKIGLNSTVNASTPSISSSDILNKPDMWFGSTAQPDGFVFMHVSGKIDTTTAANGLEVNMQPFQYRIGTNAQHNQVSMPNKNYTVVKGQVEYLHMYADYSKLFDGIQLNTNSNLMILSPSDNATALGIQLGNNMTTIFVYE